MNDQHFLSIKLGCGHNTNTRVELLNIWAMLVLAVSMGLHSLSVWGDFFVIINWTNSKSALSSLNLDYWCNRIT